MSRNSVNGNAYPGAVIMEKIDKYRVCAVFALAMTFCAACGRSPDSGVVIEKAQVMGAVYKDGPVKAVMKDAGFYYGDSTYHGIIEASDGNVYFFINSHFAESNVHMFKYDPSTDKVTMIADLNEVLGEDRTKMYPQGKVHSRIYEHNGKLYFGTHAGEHHRFGKYSWLAPYPGGHFMSYDLATGKFEDFGIGAPEQGLITVAMDKQRGRLYSLGWPDVIFCYYDIGSGTMKRFEKVSSFEARALALDPRTGNVYWPDVDGSIMCYSHESDAITRLDQPRFDSRPVLTPVSQPDTSGTQYGWRDIQWSETLNRFIGVFYTSEYLFSFDPLTGEIELIDRIAAAPLRKAGTTTTGSLAFALSSDGTVVYYIAAGEKTIENPVTHGKDQQSHLVTYSIPLRQYIDHGYIELDDGRWPLADRSLATGKNGSLYIAGWIPFRDIDTEKGSRLIAARYKNTKRETLEKDGITEVNLMVLPDPLYGEK